MKPDVIAARLAAYEAAKASGAIAYGRRKGPDAKSAARVAAEALGLKSADAVICALKATNHADWLARVERKRERMASRRRAEKRRARISAAKGSLDVRVNAALGEAAKGNAARVTKIEAARATTRRRAQGRARQAVEELERRLVALGPTAPAGEVEAFIVVRDFAARPTGATLAAMFQRGQLSVSDLRVAAEFRSAYELAHASPISAVDFSRELVSGGKAKAFAPSDGIAWQDAFYIRRARSLLGEIGFAFLVAVAVQGLGVREAGEGLRLGARVNMRGRSADGYYAGRLREALGALRGDESGAAARFRANAEECAEPV